MAKKPGWKELPKGGVIKEAGNSKSYNTGDWRVNRPIFNSEKCKQCMLCAVYCPDASIELDEKGDVVGINHQYCKGCGICSTECPFDAIDMKSESDFKKQNPKVCKT